MAGKAAGEKSINTSELVLKNAELPTRFSTNFSVFGNEIISGFLWEILLFSLPRRAVREMNGGAVADSH